MTSRRSILRGALAGASAFAVPAALAACGKSDTGSGSGGSTNKNVTFGSNYSDDVPKKAIADVMAKMQSDKGYTV
jgi:multiple sugar transport system substrate-binding protein